jgi:hypothetical protein
MGREYRIKVAVPSDFDPVRLLRKLPGPATTESYGIEIEADGFHFVDHLVDRGVAAVALRVLLDEALSLGGVVEISEP